MKFFDAIRWVNTGHKRPIDQRLAAENWIMDLAAPPPERCTETLWKLTLQFNRGMYVNDNLPEIALDEIKEQMIKEMHWQVYGELNKMLNHLAKAIYSEDFQESLEIINLIRDEYSYNP